MKLKDSLAADYWIKNTNEIYEAKLHVSCHVIDGYKAGFEKARELAVKECQTHDDRPDPVLGSKFRCRDLGCVAAKLKSLGEEEV